MENKRTINILIYDLVLCCQLIEKYLKDIEYTDFTKSTSTQDSVMRRLGIIGEIVKTLPLKLKQEYPEIPWKQISGMRDILVHEYFRVDVPLTWKICQSEIPKLKRIAKKILKEIENKK